MRGRTPCRTAFTVYDLLVLLIMLLLLLAVLLPVVGDARELSRRVACADNLKRLGLAARQYHDTHHSLPPGWWGSIGNAGPAQGGAAGPGNGPFPQLLPYLGRKDLYDRLQQPFPGKKQPAILWDPKVATVENWTQVYGSNASEWNLTALEAAATPIAALQCPSDSNSRLVADPQEGKFQLMATGAIFTQDRGGRAGSPKTATARDANQVDWGRSAPGEWGGSFQTRFYDEATARYKPLARVNYLPVGGLGRGGSPFYAQFEGVFTNRSATTLQAVNAADGTANTLMFGETAGQFFPDFGDHALQVNLFAPAASTSRGLDQRCAPGARTPQEPLPACDNSTYTVGLGQKARVNTFGSSHPAGVQFCFCDGSVRLLRRGQTFVKGSTDWYLFQQLAGFHDGFHRDTTGVLP